MNATYALLTSGLLVLVALLHHWRERRKSPAVANATKRVLPPFFGLLVLVFPFATVSVLTGHLWGLLPLLVMLVLLTPELWLVHVAWRLGVPSMAGFFASLTVDTFQRDRHGGEVLSQARALLRRPADTAGADTLLERLTQLKPLRGAGIAAQGLLLARLGDSEGARALLKSVRWLDARVCPSLALMVSLEWLAADAAERGAWREVLELTHEPASRSVVSGLLRAFALRVLGDEPVAPGLLWRRWILAGCPPGALTLLRRLAMPGYVPASSLAPPGPDAQPEPGPDAPLETTLETTLALHAACVCKATITAPALCLLAQSWEQTLGSAGFAETLEERGRELGVSNLAAVRQSFEAEVHQDLLALAQCSKISSDALAGKGRVLTALRDALPRVQLAEVEAVCDAIRARVDARRALPGVDEWREFVALRAAHQRVLEAGSPEARRLAFPRVHQDLCALAVWLTNQRGEHAISHAMFSWLLGEATAVGDERSVELQRKNTRFGPL